MQTAVGAMEKRVSALRNALEQCKERVISGCRAAVTVFKEGGIAALDRIAQFFKLRPALESMHTALDKHIQFDDKVIAQIQTASTEYHEILVDSSGYGYARHSAILPNVHTFLMAERYPALAELNQKLADIADYLAQLSGSHYVFDLQDLETETGIDFMTNGALRSTVLEMLNGRAEVGSFELDKNELTIYYNKGSLERASDQKLERDSGAKPSVLGQIKAARQAPQKPNGEPPQTHKKTKSGPEL